MSVTIKFDFRKYYSILKSNILEKINILHIFLAVLALHFFIMSTPSDGFIFDEAHYIPASIDTLNGIAANAEHTPLAKMIIGTSIGIFGNWWFAWRIMPVLFGSLSIIAVYFIASHFIAKKYALFAAAFVAFDILFFVNNSIAILDPQALFFALFGVALLLKKRYGWSALSCAIAVLSNEIALTIVGGIGIYLLLTNIHVKKKIESIKTPKLKQFKSFIIFTLIFFMVVMSTMYAYELVYKPMESSSVVSNVAATVFVNSTGNPITTSLTTSNSTNGVLITNPIQQFIFAFNYYKGLTPTIKPSASDFRPAWSWAYPIINAGNPPMYFGISTTTGTITNSIVHYYSQISYPVTIFLVPTLGLCFYYLWKKKDDGNFSKFFIGWNLATYLPWILFSIFVQKMTFNYYFLYTTPVLDIGAVWFFSNLRLDTKYKDAMLAGLLIVTILFFAYYFPINVFRG